MIQTTTCAVNKYTGGLQALQGNIAHNKSYHHTKLMTQDLEIEQSNGI